MEQWSVWDWCREQERTQREIRQYGTMLLDWTERAVDDAGARAVASITPADWPKASLEARRRLRESLGLHPLPSRTTDSGARLVGRLECDDYVVERLVLEPRHNFLMPAHLYIPRGLRGPAPAILYSPGHWMINGKTEPDIQACCIGFARLGFVVLVFDPIGQGERGATFEDHARRDLLLLGLSQEGLMAWESIRAVDYLLTREEVDGNRIGMTGASGGGLNTIYTCAADERIAVSVPVCYVVSFSRFYRAMRGLNWNNQNDLCNQVPNVIRDFEMAGLCGLIYPRPLMFINGTLDPQFPVDGARQVEAQIRQIYDQVGGDRLRATAVASDHGYVQVMREAAYGWFRKWLQNEGDGSPHPEPPHKTEPPDSPKLKCFPGARSIRSWPAMRELAAQRAAALARTEQTAPPAVLRELLAEKLGVHVSRPPVKGTLECRADQAERHVVEPEPGIEAPIFVIRSESGRAATFAAVYCSDEGKLRGQGPEFLKAVAAQGGLALAVDPRGIGETSPAPPPIQAVATLDGKLLYRPTCETDTLEFEVATNALMLGRSLLGQQVSDLIAAVCYAQQLAPGIPISVVGSGPTAALLALYASLWCEGVSTVVAERLLPSYRLLVEEDAQLFPVTAYVFDALRTADVPEVAALLAPRRLIISQPIDACLEPMQPDIAARLMASTWAEYDRQGAPQPVLLGAVTPHDLADLIL